MLAIRMQRTGRKGHAQFRVVVQDSRRTPTSGKVAAILGSYDPHTKATKLNKEKAVFYLKNGAHPSDRVIRLLQQEKVELPAWVDTPNKKEAKIRNNDKLRRNRPAVAAPAPVTEESAEAPAETSETVTPDALPEEAGNEEA